MMIGGAKYVSFRVCERVLRWSGGVKASDHKRSIPLVCELGMLERRCAKLKADEDYGEVCKHARGQGWVELGGETGFCLSILPRVGGMYTWQPLIRVEIAGLLSLLLPS